MPGIYKLMALIGIMPVGNPQRIQQAHGVRLYFLLLLFGHKLETESARKNRKNGAL